MPRSPIRFFFQFTGATGNIAFVRLIDIDFSLSTDYDRKLDTSTIY